MNKKGNESEKNTKLQLLLPAAWVVFVGLQCWAALAVILSPTSSKLVRAGFVAGSLVITPFFSALHNFLQNKLEQDEQDEPSLNSPFILAEHSVKEKDVKELLVEALKLNWQHARHIEIQRIALNLAYIGLMAAFAAFVLDKDLKPVSTLIVIHVAVFLTFLCWGMTSKWNLAFQKQIQKADACARTLQMSGNQNNILSLHEFVGFPAPDKSLTRLTVRGMFSILHWGIFSIWIIIAIFVFCFKDAEPHFNYMQEKNPEYTKCYAFPPYYHDPVVRLNVSTSSRNRP